MTSPAGGAFSSRRVLQLIDLPQPVRDVVPTDAGLVHQTFISTLNRPQVADGGCSTDGSSTTL
jgi:hypothetical protein